MFYKPEFIGKIQTYVYLPIILVMAFVLDSCESGIFDTRLSEGIIEYEVSYPSMDQDNFLAGLMPDVMTMRFKDNKFISELSAGMGMFKTNFIANSNDYSLVHSVKLVNKKYYSLLNKDQVSQINERYKNFSIIPLNDTKVISGYTCKKALVIFDDASAGEVYIYYTDEINIKDPNWSTLFAGVDGVLMEYQMTNYDITMKFVCTSVSEAEIDEDDFLLSGDYEEVSFEKLEAEILDIFSTFQ